VACSISQRQSAAHQLGSLREAPHVWSVLVASWASVSTIIVRSNEAGCAQMDVAIDSLTVETCRPLSLSWTVWTRPMRNISFASRATRGTVGKTIRE
jgi:hypothetical protein